MAIKKDYANKKKISAKSKKSHSRLSSLNYIFVMVILVGGLFTAAIFYLEYIRNITVKTSKNQHAQVKKIIRPEVLATTKKQPKFEFYYTLPKMEVAVNKVNDNLSKNTLPVISNDINDVSDVNDTLAASQINTPNQQGQNNNPNTNTNTNAYVLQIASFKELKDANELRAKLILIGFDVVVQTVQLDSGEIWHRVKTNKVSNIAKAEDLSGKLQEHNIKSMILTEKSYG